MSRRPMRKNTKGITNSQSLAARCQPLVASYHHFNILYNSQSTIPALTAILKECLVPI